MYVLPNYIKVDSIQYNVSYLTSLNDNGDPYLSSQRCV